MTLIDNLTDAADQTTTLILPDNTAATMRLRYRPRTRRWVADVDYPATGFTAKGINVCCLPNVLRAWRRLIPFGVAFMTADFTDPFDLNDFLTGRCLVYLLDEADVQAVEETVIGRPS